MNAARRALWASGLPARSLLTAAIRLYRLTLSGVLGGECRFHPSCSVYAEEAVRSRGATLGVVLSTWRVLRCNPFGKGGVDPAPRRPDRLAGHDHQYDDVIPQHSKEASA